MTSPTGPSWTWLIGPWYGGPQHELTGAKSRKVTFKLEDAHSASWDIDGRKPVAGRITELVTDLHLLRRQAPGQRAERLFRGRVGPTDDQVDADAHTVSVSALSYRAVLARRKLYSDSPLAFTQATDAAVIGALLGDTQGRPGGDLGITVAGAPTALARDHTFATGDSIADRITKLGETTAEDGTGGYEWDVLPDGQDGLTLQLWPGGRGANQGVVLELGGALAGVGRSVDPGEFANVLRISGEAPEGGGDAPAPIELAAPDLAARPEGRWDATVTDQATTADILTGRGTYVLDQQQTVQPSYTVKLRRGWWRGPGHLWLGDQARLVVMSRPRLVVDTWLRVTELTVALDDDGNEDVSVTVGPALRDFADRAASTEQRLDSQDRAIARASNRVGTGGSGLPGPAGADGDPGPPGVGVATAGVDGTGHLLVTLTNSAVLDTGYVVGPQGLQGVQGVPGTNGTNGTNGAAGADGVGAVVARARRIAASADATVAGTFVKVTELSATVVNGRHYEVSAENLGVFGPAGGHADVQFTYTTNGATPATNSPRLTWLRHETDGFVTDASLVGRFIATASGTLKVLLSIAGLAAGTHNLYAAADWPLDLVIRDLGTGGVTATGTQF